MRIDSFEAGADLIGRRIRLTWSFVPEPGESVPDPPPVTIRRKRRDFEFPVVQSPDPFLVYDSSAFPPAPVPGALLVTELPESDRADDGSRVREQTCTVAEVRGGQVVEVLRRTIRTVLGPDRALLRREIELLDVGGAGRVLDPGITYYYRLDSPLPFEQPARLERTATAGEAHRHHRALYEMLPEVYRRHDTLARVADAGTGLLPEASTAGGQLRRMMDVFGATLDSVRSSADALRSIRNTAEVDHRFLPLLAEWIGWDLSLDQDIARQRNEIRTAPALYEGVGTIPGLRSVVDHYTGWSTRVAEFAQHVARTGQPAQRNVFATVQAPGGWCGVDDAAGVLGFQPPNSVAIGGEGRTAELVGTVAEPFDLPPGTTLTIALDAALPATISIGGAGSDPAPFTAAAVAEMISASLTSVRADAVGGRVRLRSLLEGTPSRVEVMTSAASLVSLDGAPSGRLTSATDDQGRSWLAHASSTGAGDPQPQLRIKPVFAGQWRDGEPVESTPATAAADPALVALPGGHLWLGWIEQPLTGQARLRYRIGRPHPSTPARLRGDAVTPFRLVLGARMVLTGYGPAETFTVQDGDYADLESATAAEVMAAINGQLSGVSAGVAGDGSLTLTTAQAGQQISLRVDLAASTTARILGFGDRRLLGRGDWDGGIDWSPARDLPAVPDGWHAGCTATAEPDTAIRLFWSTHTAGSRRIARSRWDDQLLVATAGGVRVRADDGTTSPITTADGLPSDDVRDAVTDADATTWFATAAGLAVRGSGAAITTITATATGLLSNDVRMLAPAPDGTLWCACAAGAGGRARDGSWQRLTTADGLASNDVRAILPTPDGQVWFATAAGLSLLAAAGINTLRTDDGLPSNDVRHLAQAANGTVWIATAAGVAQITSAGAATAIDLSGLAAEANDVRAVATGPDGSTWLATAAGAVRLHPSGRPELYALGMADPDCRSIQVGPDGQVWAGTATALLVLGDTGWTTMDSGISVRRIRGPWAPPYWFDGQDAAERDPCALRDGAQLWLATARKQPIAVPADPAVPVTAVDSWQIVARRWDDASSTWSAPTAVTTAPPLPVPPSPLPLPAPGVNQPTGGRVDREPALIAEPGGGARIYFRSDRGGGQRIWTTRISAAAVPDPLQQVTAGPAGDTDPAVLALPDRPPWLLFRSDRNVALGRLGAGGPGRLAPSEASVRRFAGTVSATPADLDRNQLRRQFGDLLDYTPQRPDGSPPDPDEIYTPSTIGLYVDRGPAGRPLIGRDADRLRQLLQRFLPVNLRAVIVLRSDELDEVVFGPGNPLTESYSDEYPFAEAIGPVQEQIAVPDLGWLLFIATDGDRRTVDLATPKTMRTRSWWPPPT